jgi:Ca2+-binding RTX toxin-like protein
MHVAWRAAAVLVFAALAAGVAAEGAAAGTATGRPATFNAIGGEVNALTIDRTTSGEVQFNDVATPIVAGLFCLPLPLGQALCDPDGDPRDMDGGGVRVDLGDRDDRATVLGVPRSGDKGAPGSIAVTGGAGNDHLENASSSVVRFEGGAGDDTLVSAVGATAVLVGGTGADVTASRALCCATSYEDHDRGVRVTLDGTPNDGSPDELDDVQTSAVIGGPGADVISGDGDANALTGAGGADVLDGGGGDDTIDATVALGRPADGADTVRCGSGNDDVSAEANDRVAVDCEAIRVGGASGPPIVLDHAATRARRNGFVTLTYRGEFADPVGGGPAAGTVRLVDRTGRTASSTVAFSGAAGAPIANVRVTLNRATRRRLARSRSGALALIAQRVYREAGAAPGYARFNAPLKVRRAR